MTDTTMTCDTFADQLADYLEDDAPASVREAMTAHASACESCGALLADLVMIPAAAAALPPLAPSRDLWRGIAERIDAPVLPLSGARAARPAPSLRRGWARPAVAAAALVLFTASVTHVLTRAALAPSSPAVAAATPPAAATVAVPPETAAVAAPARLASAASSSLSGAARPSARGARAVTAPERPAREAARPPAAGGTVRLARAEPLLGEVEPVYDREISKLRQIVRERHSQLDPRTIAVLEQSVAVIDSAIAQSRAALARDPASAFLATQLNHSLEKKVELLRTAAMLPART